MEELRQVNSMLGIEADKELTEIAVPDWIDHGLIFFELLCTLSRFLTLLGA